jgi:hypothetical protein
MPRFASRHREFAIGDSLLLLLILILATLWRWRGSIWRSLAFQFLSELYASA